MAAADLLVLPTLHDEMFGMVLIEAGACGTPSVASDLGGIPEAMGEGGRLVAPGDVRGLVSVIAELIGDRPALGQLGLEAERNARNFSWNGICAAYQRLYFHEISAPSAS